MNSENCEANKFSKTVIAIRFSLFQVCPTALPFRYLLWELYLFQRLEQLFLVSIQFNGSDTAPLIKKWINYYLTFMKSLTTAGSDPGFRLVIRYLDNCSWIVLELFGVVSVTNTYCNKQVKNYAECRSVH